MTIPEESRSESPPVPAGMWHRRPLHAPPQAAWVPRSLEKLHGQPAMPALRGLRAEAAGGWSVEEFVAADRLPLAAYLTKSAAPVWVFVSIVERCLTGLIALHGSGLHHGALSPRTVLVDPEGNVVLAGCGAGGPPPASYQSGANFNEAPPLTHSLAAADLKDLGRVFRGVLGGDPDTKITVSRPDIAPLVAEWIDWLAEPPPGRAPASASQAESVFGDIRSGRAAWRPWRSDAELPPKIGSMDGRQSPVLSDEERARLIRAARLAHGSDLEWRTVIVFGLSLVGLLAGGAWTLNHFLAGHAKSKSAQEQATLLRLEGGMVPLLRDDDPGLYYASGGDIEPVPDTADAIAALEEVIRKKTGPFPAWEKELQRQRGQREQAANGEIPSPDPQWLYESDIFPPMGKDSPGRSPGDYYLVWRTRNVILTMAESRTMQSAILRSARYCGVRVMAWTVLPNQSGVVLRVPPPQPLTDERLERRIAILRGEKTAASVMARVNGKLKAGDQAGAENERRPWTASMGSVAGFFGVVQTVPVVTPEKPGKLPLWQDAPLHLSVLDPDTPEILRAAAVMETAAVKGRLVESASAWPMCSLTAAMLNYGPALRAVSVLMQNNPHVSLPLPAKADLNDALLAYRRFLGDLPPEKLEVPEITTPAPPAAGVPPEPATTTPRPADSSASQVSSARN